MRQSLIDLDVPCNPSPLPRQVRTFLREADRRIERFQRDCRAPGFVTSDFERVYAALHGLAEAGIAPGNSFCEWGSGFGVVACLAAMLDFEACGIEIEPDLVTEAMRLAEDFELPVTFWQGSFLTREDETALEDAQEFGWLVTSGGNAPGELEVGPAEFDVVYAYPWPDEEPLVQQLFDRHASAGAVLMTYHGGDVLRLRRKRRS